MVHDSTRRKMLMGLGAATATGLAGCSSSGASNNSPSNDDKNGSNGGNGSPGGQKTTTQPTTGGNNGGGNGSIGGTFKTKTIENFKDVSKWEAVKGNAQKAKGPDGNGAIRVTGNPNAGEVLWVRKQVDWNLKDKNLSFAINIDKPLYQHCIVTIRLHAPDSSSTMTLGEFVRTYDNQGWFRLDVGPRQVNGNPDLSKVNAVDLMFKAPDGGQVDFRVGDIRSVDGFDKGYIALCFDDGLASHYENAYKVMKQRDMPGTVGVITSKVGQDGFLTLKQMKEMKKEGNWQMASHTAGTKPLVEMNTPELWQTVIDAHDWLVNNGFAEDAKTIIYPKGLWNKPTVDFLKQYHRAGYRYVSLYGSMSGAVTDPWTISRGDGAQDTYYTKGMLNVASIYNQMMILTFHGVGDGSSMAISTKDFKEVVDYIAKRNMQVLTLRQVEENLMADMATNN